MIITFCPYSAGTDGAREEKQRKSTERKKWMIILNNNASEFLARLACIHFLQILCFYLRLVKAYKSPSGPFQSNPQHVSYLTTADTNYTRVLYTIIHPTRNYELEYSNSKSTNQSNNTKHFKISTLTRLLPQNRARICHSQRLQPIHMLENTEV